MINSILQLLSYTALIIVAVITFFVIAYLTYEIIMTIIEHLERRF